MNESSGFSTDQKHNLLRDNWFIQSSNKVRENGEKISKSDFDPQGWYPVTMPSTVLASLVKNGVYPDPYFGTNIKSIPGYREGQWVDKNMPKNSPFNSSWWYRTEFELPGDHKRIWLHLHGINYRANVWLNGHNIADSSTVENPAV
jgi:Glycosyl hydrolases family 2, sugar binding domain.